MWFLSQINHQETAEQNMAFRAVFYAHTTGTDVHYGEVHQNIEVATR